MRNLILYSSVSAPAQPKAKELPTRDQIDTKYTWNISDVYASVELWEQDFRWVEDNAKMYKSFEGKLGSSADDLHAGLKFDEEISMKLERLYLYAFLSKDLDLSNSSTMGRYDRIRQLHSKVETENSFFQPELIGISPEILDKFSTSKNELALYTHFFNDLFRTKQHILPKEQEKLLAMAAEVLQIPENTYQVFKNAELPYPVIKDPTGAEIKLSQGRYNEAIYDTDREYRQRAYEAFYKPFKEFSNTIASLLSGELKTDIFVAHARNFNSTLECSLNRSNIPISVYTSLVNTVNENLAPLHRWIRLRKKILGYRELHPYDNYVTLFPAVKKEYSYDVAVQLVKEALKPLGNDYIKNLTLAFENRWIDVYETKGKMSGAYSSGVTFGTHPYVLLNWANQLNDVFTLAHEMGHNMHSLYTEKSQPFVYANYSIFLAEVASTCNEALLLDYLIDHASSKEEKLSLLEKYISNINSTFYRQVMFAEFEKVTHEKAEQGEALTSEAFTAIYKDIVEKYSGPDATIDELETYTWSRIPHFYRSFYVYQYATSFAASQVLMDKIKNEGQPAIEGYLKFLCSGNSDYPINILKKAGVDMSSPEPVISTIKKMNELMDEMEKLLAEN